MWQEHALCPCRRRRFFRPRLALVVAVVEAVKREMSGFVYPSCVLWMCHELGRQDSASVKVIPTCSTNKLSPYQGPRVKRGGVCVWYRPETVGDGGGMPTMNATLPCSEK